MKIFNIMKFFNSSKPKNILLADEDLKALKLGKAFFQRKGFKVFTVTSGKDVLTIYNKETIDLIMLALYLPVMNGDEVCRKIRSDNQLRDISLIMVLPSSNPEDEAICRKSGANEFISKPINESRLQNIIYPRVSRLLNVSPRKEMNVSVRFDRNGKDSQFGNTLNLSMTGMLLETHSPFKVSDLVPLSLRVPRKNNILDLEGRIVREGKNSLEGLNRYGIRFLEMCMKEKKDMKMLIEQI